MTEAMMAQGTWAFTTCGKQVYVPAPFLVQLASAQYPGPNGEPKDFHAAFDSWVQCQTLVAIGQHSIL